MKRWLLTICALTVFTLGAMAQTYFSEDFNSGDLPAGWTQVTAASDGGWLFGSATQLSSQYYGIPDNGTNIAATNDDGCNCDKNADYLILPPVDLSTATFPLLQFDHFFRGLTFQNSTEVATVEVSTDQGATWNVVATMPGATAFEMTTGGASLVDYAGQSDVWVAFNYHDGGGWLYGWAIDNVEIIEIPGKDVGIEPLSYEQFFEVGDDAEITGTIVNNGGETLTAVDITWTDGTNDYTETVTGLNVAYKQTYNFTHGTPLSVSAAQFYDIQVSVSNPNGGADENTDDNAESRFMAGVQNVPTKRVVGEEATGTWCPWCPRGTIFMDSSVNVFPDQFVGIAVHNADPMVVTEYDDGLTSIPGVAFPIVAMDRNSLIDPSQLLDVIPMMLTEVEPVSISLTGSFDETSRELELNVRGQFETSLEGVNYRLNAVVIEDGVTGTGSAYDQANAYAGGQFGEMGGYENLPNPVPAAQMVYDHVARAILGGWAGQVGSIPNDISLGDAPSHNFSYTIPGGYDIEKIKVIGMVIDNDNDEIMNAIELPLGELVVSSVENVTEFAEFNVFPTITTSTAQANVAFDQPEDVMVTVFNAQGQLISTENVVGVTRQQFTIDLTTQPSGTYFVNITVGNTSKVATVVKQ